jgi:hypothetical protein
MKPTLICPVRGAATTVLFGLLLIVTAGVRTAMAEAAFRPPAVPLVTSDPFLSIWSEADRLTDAPTRHWTRHEHALVSLIRVDGKAYRLMGTDPGTAPALPQVGLEVKPTRTIYDFDDGHIHVTLAFMTPALPNDLEAMALPLSYINWTVSSVDGKSHAIALYASASSQLVVNNTSEKVEWAREPAGNLTALRIGTQEQPILGSSGDDHRINWGYAYLTAAAEQAKAIVEGNSRPRTTPICRGRSVTTSR